MTGSPTQLASYQPCGTGLVAVAADIRAPDITRAGCVCIALVLDIASPPGLGFLCENLQISALDLAVNIVESEV